MQFPSFQHTQSLFDVSKLYMLSAHWCSIESPHKVCRCTMQQTAPIKNSKFLLCIIHHRTKKHCWFKHKSEERELNTHVNPMPIYPVLIALHVLCAFYDERKLDAFLFIVLMSAAFVLVFHFFASRKSREQWQREIDRYMIL